MRARKRTFNTPRLKSQIWIILFSEGVYLPAANQINKTPLLFLLAFYHRYISHPGYNSGRIHETLVFRLSGSVQNRYSIMDVYGKSFFPYNVLHRVLLCLCRTSLFPYK